MSLIQDFLKEKIYKLLISFILLRNLDYKSHTKCLTESERYESKNSYVSKANKGELKQNAWIDVNKKKNYNLLLLFYYLLLHIKIINQVVDHFRGNINAKTILEKLSDFPNVPRKKAKFFNFIKNSFRSYRVADSLLEEIWNVIELFNQNTSYNNKQQEESKEIPNNKRKFVEENKNDKVELSMMRDCKKIKFDWFEIIKKYCSKQEEKQIEYEKLLKKVKKIY